MTYRTLAWLMALICGLAIPAGAATLGDGFFDQPIFPPHAYEQLANLRAETRGVIARNTVAKDAVQDRGMLAATTAKSKGGIVVDNALLVSVNGNALVDKGLGNAHNTYNKNITASVNNSFIDSIGVANMNAGVGNFQNQSTSFSGSLPSGLLASGGSTNAAAVLRQR